MNNVNQIIHASEYVPHIFGNLFSLKFGAAMA